MKAKFILLISLLVVLALATAMPAEAKKVKEPLSRGAFIDYAKGKRGKGGAKPQPDTTPTDENTSYKYTGVHWTDPNVNYRVDGASSGLEPSLAKAAIQAGFDAWEKELNPFELPDMSIINYTYDPGPVSFSGGPNLDGENSVSWGPTPQNAIAVTYYWYTRKGKRLVEFDMVFSNALPWSTSGSPHTYDIQNIAAHEAGHTLVLADLYNSYQSELTMYGYGALGETKKRDLGRGDMLGVESIYPAP